MHFNSWHQPELYDRFVGLLGEFSAGKLSEQAAVVQIDHLLRNSESLTREFHRMLGRAS